MKSINIYPILKEGDLMKVNNVYIKNFRGYGSNPHTCDGYFAFEGLSSSGIVILAGYNGFGKTSFFDAIEWCLTGSISRLMQRKKIQMQSNLKESHQLKFVKAKATDFVDVIVNLSNGKSIRRVSVNESIFSTDYSTTILNENGEEISENDILEIFNIDGGMKTLTDINFLGQDNISGFLHRVKATDRTQEFMRLMGLNELSDITLESVPQKFNILDNQIKQIETDIWKKEQNSEKINKLFETLEWNSIEDYLSALKLQLQSYNIVLAKLTVEQLQSTFDTVDTDNVSNDKLLESLNSITLHSTRLTTLKTETEHKKKRIIDKIFLNRFRNNLSKHKQLQLLQNTNLSLLSSDSSKYKKQHEIHDKSKAKLEETLETVSTFERKIKSFSLSKDLITSEDIKNIKELYKDSKEITRLATTYCTEEFGKKDYLTEDQLASFLQESNNFNNRINEISTEKSSLDSEITSATSINSSYSKLLKDVRAFLESNSNIDHCPICTTSDFKHLVENPKIETSLDMNTKDLLLASMDYTEANSSNLVKEKIDIRNKKIALMNELTITYTQNTYDKLNNSLNTIIEILFTEINALRNKIDSQVSCNKNSADYYTSKINTLAAKMDNYNALVMKLFNLDDSSNINDELIKSRSDKLQKVIEDQRLHYHNNLNASGTVDPEQLYSEELKIQNEVKIDCNAKSISELNSLFTQTVMIEKSVSDLSKYTLTKEFIEVIKEYYEILESLSAKEMKLDSYKQDKETIKEIHRNATLLQTQLLKERIERNPLIQWIYQTINPHPFFRNVHISSEDTGLNLKDSENGNYFLDHMFSTAQTNVLAISMFLGVALTQKISPLQQIFMDDPIQSMDDINILAYIDLLRAIDDSVECRSDIIVSTHDIEFSKLLMIKFRKRSFKMYSFEGYNSYGPDIVEY